MCEIMAALFTLKLLMVKSGFKEMEQKTEQQLICWLLVFQKVTLYWHFTPRKLDSIQISRSVKLKNDIRTLTLTLPTLRSFSRSPALVANPQNSQTVSLSAIQQPLKTDQPYLGVKKTAQMARRKQAGSAIAQLNIHQQARSIARINHARDTTFYSAVEASSVTPFFRAVDQELADRDLRIKTKETGFLP